MTHGMLKFVKVLDYNIKNRTVGKVRASYDLRGFWKDLTKKST